MERRKFKVLHAYNTHRGFGGSEVATAATLRVLREGGVEVVEFTRDSNDLPQSLGGKAAAFVGGLYAAGAVRDFEATLVRERPDVVHVHELYPLISPWILPSCTRAGIPVVMSCSDFRLTCPIATHYVDGENCYRCMGGREHWCVIRNCRKSVPESAAYALRNASARAFGLFARHVSRFVTASEFQRRFLIDNAGLAPGRVAVNDCAVPLPPAPVDDPAAGVYVGYAGRFAPEKGVEVMVEACRAARVPMALAGREASHPSVRPDDDATFDLTPTSADLAAFYRRARVMVVPSLWTETFGLVAAEAMSHGIPVVASRMGALAETVVEGETGLLAEPGNARDFAAKIAQLWNDPALVRRLGAQARARVATRFSAQAHFDRLVRVYDEVTEQPGGGVIASGPEPSEAAAARPAA